MVDLGPPQMTWRSLVPDVYRLIHRQLDPASAARMARVDKRTYAAVRDEHRRHGIGHGYKKAVSLLRVAKINAKHARKLPNLGMSWGDQNKREQIIERHHRVLNTATMMQRDHLTEIARAAGLRKRLGDPTLELEERRKIERYLSGQEVRHLARSQILPHVFRAHAEADKFVKEPS